jgi:hypothetical protein
MSFGDAVVFLVFPGLDRELLLVNRYSHAHPAR